MSRNCFLPWRQGCADPGASRSKHAATHLSAPACLMREPACSTVYAVTCMVQLTLGTPASLSANRYQNPGKATPGSLITVSAYVYVRLRPLTPICEGHTTVRSAGSAFECGVESEEQKRQSHGNRSQWSGAEQAQAMTWTILSASNMSATRNGYWLSDLKAAHLGKGNRQHDESLVRVQSMGHSPAT